MHIGNTNPGNEFTMERLHVPNEFMIETVTEENDLGVTFDNELKFSKHIAVCVNKANQRVGLLRRTKYLGYWNTVAQYGIPCIKKTVS